MEVVRTSSYVKSIKRLSKAGATAEDIRSMELGVAAAPGAGDVIPGSGGIRKLRFGFGGRGKRGGGRVLYYVWTDGEAVILLTAYAKWDQADVSAHELSLFSELIEELIDDQEN